MLGWKSCQNCHDQETDQQAKPWIGHFKTARNIIWIVGIVLLLTISVNQAIVTLLSGFACLDLTHLLTACFLSLSWLYLKPNSMDAQDGIASLNWYERNVELDACRQGYLQKTQLHMSQRQAQHLISQNYLLPFPYLCQIYHLLNLNHLETVHGFSLNNLKVTQVQCFQPTDVGGNVKFETVLESPLNILRIWRQPIVEVELILHNPYTIELCLPLYKDHKINVMFNVLPIGAVEHQFLIDIYCDLIWFKPVLKILLHLAASLTLLEDLPYLSKLAERNLQRLVDLNHISPHKSMQLFRRYADLHALGVKPLTPA
jgi:hypothetical protein